MELTLEKFRCFGETQIAKLAPITLLVGENSTGKSSFMAALRYMLEFSAGYIQPSFNKDPFFLGGHKNIAHYRGGKYGRDSNFSLAISETFKPRKSNPEPELFEADIASESTISLRLTFADLEGDAVPTRYEIRLGSKCILIDLNGTNAEARVINSDIDFEHSINTKKQRGLIFTRMDFVTLEYFLRDLIFTARHDEGASQKDKVAGQIITEVWEVFRRLRAIKSSSVLALAPVRTRPQRNYDPTRLSQSSEGDQLIGQLGRIARKGDRQWELLKDKLESYGKITGLFDSIAVKKLGNLETNPFQIHVKKSGRDANIIDVGYGVSQVLPLFIMLTELDRNSTILVQQPEVHLHPSAQAALGTVFAQSARRRNSPNFVIETHSDFIVDRIRLAVREKKLAAEDVRILFFSKSDYNSVVVSVEVDEDGEFISPPEAYRDFFVRENLSLLGFS